MKSRFSEVLGGTVNDSIMISLSISAIRSNNALGSIKSSFCDCVGSSFNVFIFELFEYSYSTKNATWGAKVKLIVTTQLKYGY